MWGALPCIIRTPHGEDGGKNALIADDAVVGVGAVGVGGGGGGGVGSGVGGGGGEESSTSYLETLPTNSVSTTHLYGEEVVAGSVGVGTRAGTVGGTAGVASLASFASSTSTAHLVDQPSSNTLPADLPSSCSSGEGIDFIVASSSRLPIDEKLVYDNPIAEQRILPETSVRQPSTKIMSPVSSTFNQGKSSSSNGALKSLPLPQSSSSSSSSFTTFTDQESLRSRYDPSQLSDRSPLKIAMASCHSLTIIDGQLTGDPLDLTMFQAVKWVSQH